MLGLGFMGRTHLQALKNIPQAEVVAVASDVPEALTGDLSSVQGNLGTSGEKFDFSGMNKYSDWKDAVADPAVEAVDICLPTHLHAPAALAAIEAGKHVLLEKPLA
ncbi:MAG: Gfo/Idh/MocA family oxidoreductase, partial [bacterium]|nr:Gfo/Idh/MocA family oxidoreductase [bacterium]